MMEVLNFSDIKVSEFLCGEFECVFVFLDLIGFIV